MTELLETVVNPWLRVVTALILFAIAGLQFQQGKRKAAFFEALAAIVLLSLAIPALAEPIEPQDVHVVDGDTIDWQGERYRLVGFNTPEPNARCEAGRRLARQAKVRLQEIVHAGALDLTSVPCACKPGTEGTKRCNRGRLCGLLTHHTVDVAEIMIQEGYAAAFLCGRTSCPRMPRPWCE